VARLCDLVICITFPNFVLPLGHIDSKRQVLESIEEIHRLDFGQTPMNAVGLGLRHGRAAPLLTSALSNE
jgi:hypothetical protein